MIAAQLDLLIGWGKNSEGQLGVNAKEDVVFEPRKLPLKGVTQVRICTKIYLSTKPSFITERLVRIDNVSLALFPSCCAFVGF